VTTNLTPPPDDEPLSGPDEALALIHEQQRTVTELLYGSVPWIYTMWGIAWGVGFLALWSGYDDGNPWFRLPLGLAAAIFGGLMTGALITSFVAGAGIGRGVRGASAFSGTIYGISWAVGLPSVFLIGIALAGAGADGALLSLYFPAASGTVIGLIYFMGAALWRSIDQLVLGAVIIVVGTVAPFFGAPTNNLVMAVLGGGSFLIAAIVMRLSRRRR